MNVSKITRLFLSIVFSLLLNCSLCATLLDIVVIADVTKDVQGNTELQQFFQSMQETVDKVNSTIIDPINVTRKKRNQPLRLNIRFYPQDEFHVTLGYVGSIETEQTYQGHDYVYVFNELKDAIESAINAWNKKRNQHDALALNVNKSYSWPLLGLKKKIWVSFDLSAYLKDTALDTLALVTGIQDATRSIQNKYQCFKDREGTVKQYPPYNSFRDIKLHLSVGTIDPPLENLEKTLLMDGVPERSMPSQALRKIELAQSVSLSINSLQLAYKDDMVRPPLMYRLKTFALIPSKKRTQEKHIAADAVIRNLDHPSELQFNPYTHDSLIAKQKNDLLFVYDIPHDPIVRTCNFVSKQEQPFKIMFGPKGNLVALASRTKLYAISVANLIEKKCKDFKVVTSVHTMEPTVLLSVPSAEGSLEDTFFTASADGKSYVWTLKKDRNVFSFALDQDGMNHKKRINDAGVSSDGTKIVTASDDNTAIVWYLDQHSKSTLSHSSPVTAVSLSADGTRVATASMSTVEIWRSGGRKIVSYDFFTKIQDVRFVGTSLFVRLKNAVVQWENVMQINPGGPEKFDFVRYDEQGVETTTFSVNGNVLVVGTSKGSAQVWDIREKGKGPKAYLDGHAGPITSIAWSKDGAMAATSDDNSIKVFNVYAL